MHHSLEPAAGRPAHALRPESTRAAGPQALDLRAMPAPEPLVRALAAAERLSPGDELVVLTPMLPMPLLEQLLARGLRANVELRDDGSARVWIRKS